jgi:hypothetical protein
MPERVIAPLSTPPGARSGVVAPFQFVVTGEDNLRWRTWCGYDPAGQPGLTGLSLRMIDAAGKTQITTYQQAPLSASAPAETIITLGEGAVVNLAVRYVPFLISAAATYVTVELIRGTNTATATVIAQLLGGYVTNGRSLTWPGSPIDPWTVGSGIQRRIDLTPAGAGLEASHHIAPCRAFRLIALSGTFIAGGAAGTRFPTFRLGVYGFPGLEYARLPLLVTIGPGASAELNWADGYGSQMLAVSPRYYGPVPQGLILPPDSVVESQTVGITAGDVWSPVYLYGEEYVIPSL